MCVEGDEIHVKLRGDWKKINIVSGSTITTTKCIQLHKLNGGIIVRLNREQSGIVPTLRSALSSNKVVTTVDKILIWHTY